MPIGVGNPSRDPRGMIPRFASKNNQAELFTQDGWQISERDTQTRGTTGIDIGRAASNSSPKVVCSARYRKMEMDYRIKNFLS